MSCGTENQSFTMAERDQSINQDNTMTGHANIELKQIVGVIQL